MTTIYQITNPKECEEAANRLNKNYVYEEDDSHYPTCCYNYYGDVYFNHNFADARREDSQPICGLGN